MKKSLILLLLCCILIGFIASGCTQAGPYVTNVGYDGQGNLVITKNTVVFNWFFGTIGNGDKETTVMIRSPKSKTTE